MSFLRRQEKMRMRGANLETLMKSQMSSVMTILSIFWHPKSKNSGFLFNIFDCKNTLKYFSHYIYIFREKDRITHSEKPKGTEPLVTRFTESMLFIAESDRVHCLLQPVETSWRSFKWRRTEKRWITQVTLKSLTTSMNNVLASPA